MSQLALDGMPKATEPETAEPKKPRSRKARQHLAALIEKPDEPEIGYLARPFILCGLPMKDPGKDKLVWSRSNGHETVSIKADVDAKTGKSIGVPYGSIIRLLMIWLSSEAKKGDRRIYMGKSGKAFVEMIGKNPETGTGKRSDLRSTREQVKRFTRSRWSYTVESGDDTKGSDQGRDMLVTDERNYWWDFSDPNQPGLFEGFIVLSEQFFKFITENPVPIDFRAVVALKQSPFAIDLYTWLSWRIFRMNQSGEKSRSIRLWGAGSLAEQFGTGYSREDNFKAAFADVLGAVRQVWPELDCDQTTTHLTLRPCRVPIADSAPLKKSRRLGRVKADQLSIHTEAWFRATFPKNSLTTAVKDFRRWTRERGIEINDVDGLFRDFAPKWVVGNE